MMTEHDDPTLDRLKHHFAQRVINQARQVLEVWQRLTRAEWNSDGMEELADATLRLQRYAERFREPTATPHSGRGCAGAAWGPPEKVAQFSSIASKC